MAAQTMSEGPRRRTAPAAALAVLLCACAAWAPADAEAASQGVLDYGGCISSSPGVEACETAPQFGLGTISDLELSADGDNAYTTSEDGDAVSWLRREPATGALTWGGCVSPHPQTGCDQVPGGTPRALDVLLDLALSADGKSLYAASRGGDAVSSFDRDPESGALTFAGCISSDTQVTECELIPDASEGGDGTGLNGASAVVVAADGEHVYAGATQPGAGSGQAVSTFARDPQTGELAYEGCLSGKLTTVGCEFLPNATGSGPPGPLGGIRRMLLSADGHSLYVAAEFSDTIVHLDIDPETGEPAYASCLTSSTDITDLTGCTLTPTGGSSGVLGPLAGVFGLSEGPEGETLYATSRRTSAVTTFARDPETGELAFSDCLTADTRVATCEHVPGSASGADDAPFEWAFSPVVSADGTWLYLAGGLSSSLVRFERDPESGDLSYADCLSSETTVTACEHTADASASGSGTALQHADALALSPDGNNHLYAGSFLGAAISGYHRVLPPNRIGVVSFARNKRRGTGRLRLALQAAGRIALSGPKAKAAQRSAGKAREVTLRVEPLRAARVRLRRRGHVRIRVELSFTPEWGVERTIARRLRLVRR